MRPHNGVEIPQPQLEEDITEVRWAAKEFLPEMKKNIYPAVAELLINTGGNKFLIFLFKTSIK